MARKTKHDYHAPGSFARCLEAAIALADADSDDDAAFKRAEARLRAAIVQFRFQTQPRRRATPHEQLPLRNMARFLCDKQS